MSQIVCFNTILQYFYKNLVDYLALTKKYTTRMHDVCTKF